jgi:hypothetical protein
VLEINVSSLKPSQVPQQPSVLASSSYPTDAHTSIDLLTHRLKTLEYRIGDLEADDVDEYLPIPLKQSRKQRHRASSSSRSPTRRTARYPSDESHTPPAPPPPPPAPSDLRQQVTIEFISETLKELLQKIQKYKQNSNEMAETMRAQSRELNQHLIEQRVENHQLKERVSKIEKEQKVDLQKVMESLSKKQNKTTQSHEDEGEEDDDKEELGMRFDRRVFERGMTAKTTTAAAATAGAGNEQIKFLQNKIKSLSLNTSKVCKSLSVGISDSQYSILMIFSWAERVHSAFEILATELDLGGGLCPRLQLQNQKGVKPFPSHHHHSPSHHIYQRQRQQQQQQSLLEEDNEDMINIPTYFQGKNIENTFGLDTSDEER